MSDPTSILDFLRAQGLTVLEVNGWRTRGRITQGRFNPHGSVNHHTAGGRSGSAPSLGICINGRSDLPGPLCQVLQSRQQAPDGLDVVYLIAAGVANHAGSGGWMGLAGNSSVWGVEVEHTGVAGEPFPESRVETSARVHAAFALCSGFDPVMVCQHREWTTTKVDFYRPLLDANSFRSRVAARLAPAHTPLPSEDDMPQPRYVVGVPWQSGPAGNGPRFLVDRNDDGTTTAISVADARFDPPWTPGAHDGVEDFTFLDFWCRRFRAAGPPIGTVATENEVAFVAADTIGMYTLARRPGAAKPIPPA